MNTDPFADPAPSTLERLAVRWHLSDRAAIRRVLEAALAWEADPGTRDEPNWQASSRLIDAVRAYRAHGKEAMTADPAPSTETLTLERLAAALRKTTNRHGWAITVSQGTSWEAIARAILAADPSLLDAARQQGAAEERARLRELMTSMALSLGWSHDLYAALVSWLAEPDAALASPPDAEPPAEEGT